MTIRSFLVSAAVLTAGGSACVPANPPSGQPDAAVPRADAASPPTADAAPPPCPTWYEDRDGDGYGNPSVTKTSCMQPAGFVAAATDCDDTTARRFPGNREVCDTLDNDCDATTGETCPPGCIVETGPGGHRYLFCLGQEANSTWSDASTSCASQGYKMVKIDNDTENFFVMSHMPADQWFWLGAQKNGENTWTWSFDGSALPDGYQNWADGEPNDANGIEDSLMMYPSATSPGAGAWNDYANFGTLGYVCERVD